MYQRPSGTGAGIAAGARRARASILSAIVTDSEEVLGLSKRSPPKTSAGRGGRGAAVGFGSGIAFLTAQLMDVAIFDRLRAGRWWRAPLVSSLVAGAVDTALFFAIAFSATLAFVAPSVDVAWAGEVLPLLGLGPAVPLWVSLAVADFGVKTSIALLALVPFRLVIGVLRARAG